MWFHLEPGDFFFFFLAFSTPLQRPSIHTYTTQSDIHSNKDKENLVKVVLRCSKVGLLMDESQPESSLGVPPAIGESQREAHLTPPPPHLFTPQCRWRCNISGWLRQPRFHKMIQTPGASDYLQVGDDGCNTQLNHWLAATNMVTPPPSSLLFPPPQQGGKIQHRRRWKVDTLSCETTWCWLFVLSKVVGPESREEEIRLSFFFLLLCLACNSHNVADGMFATSSGFISRIHPLKRL